MSMQDPVADLLTRIRNAQRAKMTTVVAPYSKQKSEILKVLKETGYILDFEQVTPNSSSPAKKRLKDFLKIL